MEGNLIFLGAGSSVRFGLPTMRDLVDSFEKQLSILAKYIDWDRYSKKFGFVSLPSEALNAIMEATEPDKLRKAVEEYSVSVPKDIVMFRYKKLDLESCLMLLSILSRYASMFKYELQIEQQRNYTTTKLTISNPTRPLFPFDSRGDIDMHPS